MSSTETTTRQLPKSNIFKFQLPLQRESKGIQLKLPRVSNKVTQVTSTFKRAKGNVIVPFDGSFFYFPFASGSILPSKESDSVYRVGFAGNNSVFDRLPGTDFFICIGDFVYFVTSEDLARGVIRKSRKLNLKRGNITYDDFKSGNHLRTADRRLYEKLTGTETSVNEEQVADDQEIGQVFVGTTEGSTESNSGEAAGSFTPSLFAKTKRNRQSLDGRGPGENFDLAELEAIDLAMQDQECTLRGIEGS